MRDAASAPTGLSGKAWDIEGTAARRLKAGRASPPNGKHPRLMYGGLAHTVLYAKARASLRTRALGSMLSAGQQACLKGPKQVEQHAKEEKDDVNDGQEARKIRPNEGRQEHHGRPRGHRGLIYLRHRGRRLQGGHRQILVSTSTNRRVTTTHSPQARLASAHRREREGAAAVVRASGAHHHHHLLVLLGHHHGGARAPQGGRHHHRRTLEPYYYYPRRQTSPRPADTTKKRNKKGVRTLEEDAQARRPTVAPP